MTLPREGEARFPVSVKGVLFEEDQVVLLLNERDEWELPGGRLERGEDPVVCLEREFAEELGVEVRPGGVPGQSGAPERRPLRARRAARLAVA